MGPNDDEIRKRIDHPERDEFGILGRGLYRSDDRYRFGDQAVDHEVGQDLGYGNPDNRFVECRKGGILQLPESQGNPFPRRRSDHRDRDGSRGGQLWGFASKSGYSVHFGGCFRDRVGGWSYAERQGSAFRESFG